MKKFFSKIVSFLQNLFTNLDSWIHEHVQPSIETVQRIKEFINSPLADAVLQVIPGDADEALRDWISVHLDKAISVLGLVKPGDTEKTLDQKVLDLSAVIKAVTPSMQNSIYLRLASEMAKSSGSKDEVKGHSVDLLTQMQYSKLAEGVESADLPVSKYTAGYTEPQKYYNVATGNFE